MTTRARPAVSAAPRRRRSAPTGEAPRHVLFETAIGTCGIAYGPGGVLAVLLPSHSDASTGRALARLAEQRTGSPSTEAEDPPAAVLALCEELREHLAGHPRTFADVALDLAGLTEFRCAVYRAARQIPSGQVQTYAEVAKLAGSPGAARAVGRALATNPFAVVVPCHRVLGAEHDLHGFSAPGGVKTKARLLKLEGAELEAPGARHGAPTSDDQKAFPFDT